MRTKSEDLFESFLTANNVQFEKIKEDTSPQARPLGDRGRSATSVRSKRVDGRRSAPATSGRISPQLSRTHAQVESSAEHAGQVGVLASASGFGDSTGRLEI